MKKTSLTLLAFLAVSTGAFASGWTKGEIEVYQAPGAINASGSFRGDVAKAMYEVLNKRRPATVPAQGEYCNQITAQGIACSETRTRQDEIVYRCLFHVEGTGVIHLPNPVLCPISVGIGVGN